MMMMMMMMWAGSSGLLLHAGDLPSVMWCTAVWLKLCWRGWRGADDGDGDSGGVVGRAESGVCVCVWGLRGGGRSGITWGSWWWESEGKPEPRWPVPSRSLDRWSQSGCQVVAGSAAHLQQNKHDALQTQPTNTHTDKVFSLKTTITNKHNHLYCK